MKLPEQAERDLEKVWTNYIHSLKCDSQLFQLSSSEHTVSQELLKIFVAQLELCSNNACISCSTKLSSCIEIL